MRPARLLGCALALCVLPLAGSGELPAADRAAARAIDLLIQRQRPNGSFEERRPKGFKLYERHSDGAHGVAGLAILAQRGYCAPVEKVLDYLMDRQRSDGCLSPRGTKCNLEHAYCLQLMIEVALAQQRGAAFLHPRRAARLQRAIKMAVGYLVAQQTPGGGWPYAGPVRGWYSRYLESATWVPVMEALLLARNLGLRLPPATMQRALTYLETREKPDGFLNGAKEKQVISPHVTCAVLSVLEGIPGKATRSWRSKGWRYVGGLERAGFFKAWGYEPTDPKLDQYAELKVVLGARRHLYGHWYLMLCHTRGGDAGRFARHYDRAARHLLANRTGALWSSTAGELASTGLAVLSLSAPHRRLALYGRLGNVPGWD